MEAHRIAASPVSVGALVLWVVSLTACGAPDPNVATQHNDNFRTGAYLAETVLTPAAVRNRGMRVKYWLSPCYGFIPNAPPGRPTGCIDGAIETQPLYVSRVPFNIPVPVGSVSFDAPGVFVATMTNKVYGIHAETGQQVWMTDLMLDAGAPAVIPGYVPRGIASTPVIDVANNRMYVLFGTKNQYPDLPSCLDLATADPPTRDRLRRQALDLDVRYWIAMLDLRNGDVLQVRQIIAVVRRSDGSQVGFLGKNHISHPALLLDRGSVYVGFGSPAWSEGCVEYHGWLIRYNAQNLDRLNVFNTSRDWRLNEQPPTAGSGIWQGGGGLVADGGGNVYFLTGNGRADTSLEMLTPWGFARQRAFYGNSFVKVTPASGNSFRAWAWAPPDAADLDAKDADLGSGGAMIVPDSGVVLGGGKSGFMYVLDRASMGLLQKYTGTTNQYNPSLRGETWDKGPHLHGSPTYWAGPEPTHGYLYVWGEKDVLRQYRFNKSTQRIEEPPFRQGTVKALWNVMPGGMLSVSANGTRAGTGIVWATLPIAVRPTPHPGGLYAFDAETLSFLWNTSYGTVSHWVPPTIADGKVFLAEGSSQWDGSQMLIVYELGRPDGSDRGPREPFQPQSPPTCKYCHTPGPGLEGLTQKMAMSDHHRTGGGVRVKPGLALAALLPPPGHTQVAVLEGNGHQVYEAAPAAGAPNTLEWILRDTTAELVEIKPVDAGDRRSLQVRHSEGSTWSASDGSTIVGEIEKQQSAPEAIDTDWLLYKVTKDAGQGFLSRVTYVRKVFTHAGRPPAARPTRRGERVSVAYSAQYWLYR